MTDETETVYTEVLDTGTGFVDQEVQAALDAAHLAGYSVVPANLDKAPKVRWKEWQTRRQTGAEFDELGHGSLWGIVTGNLYGVTLLDFDGPEGLETLRKLGLPIHVKTPTGAHVYVRHPGHPVKNSARKFPEYLNMDTRGDGGLAWFAGRSKKGTYEALVWPPVPVDLDPELAARIFPLHEETKGADRALYHGQGRGEPESIRFTERAAQDLERSTPGSSNAALNKAGYSVGGLIASGTLDEAWAYEHLHAAAEKRGAQDIDVVLNAALAAGAESPWKIEPVVVDGDTEWVPAVAYKMFRNHGVPEPVPFPIDALPAPLDEFVRQASTSTSAPPDYVGTSLLPVLGTAIGGYVSLRVTETWSESALIYAAIVGSPGARKSPSINLVMGPVWDAEGRMEDIARQAAAEDDKDWTEVEPPQLVVDDSTIEALFGVLERNERGVLLQPDELLGWVGGMGQYKGGLGRDRQHWLSIWSRRPIKVSRVKARSRVIRKPFVGVLGGIQPEPLEALMHGKDDGLLPRLLMAQGDFVTPRLRRGTMDPQLQVRYAELWNRLRDEGTVEQVVEFTDPGFEAFETWANLHYETLGNVPAELAGAWAKMDGQLARIALILARIEGTSVTPEIVERAALLVRYYQGQAAQLLQGSAAVTPWERQQANRTRTIVRYLQQHPEAEKPDLMSLAEWAMDLRTLDRLLEPLIDLGIWHG